ncbi:MAG: segregation/condensation protein A [Candidatus Andersenbacteria bacterium]
MPAHIVKTKEFEGPLDLLLDLIEQNKLDITTVSLAKITDDYVEQVRGLQEVNVESLVDFLVIASQLLVIKSRALLPVAEATREEPATAEELAARLAELKKFRTAAETLARVLASKRFAAAREPLVTPVFYPPPGLKATDLATAFTSVVESLPSAELLDEEVVGEVVTLEDKLARIQRNLKTVSKMSFGELIDKATKTEIIVTFLAMLELMKQRLVSVDQDELFGEIKISAQLPE